MTISPLLSVRLCRLRIVMLLLLACILSSCSYTIFPASPATETKGPIQFYDAHGVLICQLHGQNTQLDCLAQNSVQRPFAFQFIDYALKELASDLHTTIAHLPSTALSVSTTLDLNLQKQILQKAKLYIATMATTQHITNAAVVMLDYHNGAIRTLIGSLDSPTANSSLNVVTQNPRQLGSIFKPFVYATAFEQGISPGEVIYDGPFSVGTPPYSPVNYGQGFHGYLSYRSALQNDYNIPALKVFLRTGYAALRKNVLAMGLTPSDIGTAGSYSIPLGPKETPLLDATVAYGTMANRGVHTPPHAIEKISTSDGHVVFTTKPQGTQALTSQTAFIMTNVMSDEQARFPEFGTCSVLELYTTSEAQCKAGNPGTVRPVAVHIGVTDTFRDTLTVGYTTDMVMGTWTGNSDYSPMYNITGLDGAARIWHDSMLLAEAGQPVQQFPGPPSGVVKQTVQYPHLTTTDWHLIK